MKVVKMYERVFKRMLDVLGAGILLVAFLIPMLIIGVIIKFVSPGPVLFRQRRYGKNSKPFTMVKFRTMTVGTPLVANQNFTNMNSYLFSFGKFLRKTSLDELPQLINVLFGQMSFIGPRPLADSDIAVVRMRQDSGAERVTPGISGLAQVRGRNSITDEAKVEYDTIYASHVTFSNDITIVLETIMNVLGQKDINRTNKL